MKNSIKILPKGKRKGNGVKGKWISLYLAVFLMGLVSVQAAGRIEISEKRVEIGTQEEILKVPDYDQKPAAEAGELPTTPVVQTPVKPPVYQETPTAPAEEPCGDSDTFSIEEEPSAASAVPAEEQKKEAVPAVPRQSVESAGEETKKNPETTTENERGGWKHWLPEEVKEGEEMTWLAGLAGILAVFLILLRKILKDRRKDNREIEALRNGEQVCEAFLDSVMQKRKYEDIQDYLHREMKSRWGAEDYREFVEKIEADYGTIESKEFYSFHQFEDMTQLLYMAVCSKVPKVQIGFHLKPSPQGVKIHAFLFVPPQG